MLSSLMKISLFFLFSFFVISSYSQPSDSFLSGELTPSEMRDDLTVYTRLLKETHPGLYRYLSKENFENAVANIDSKIGKPLPFYEFYALLAELNAKIRCAHTQLYPTADVLDYIRTQCKLFPYYIYPLDDKLYVIFNGTNDTTVKPGYELVSINDNPVREIWATTQKYHYRDGNSNDVVRKFLQGNHFAMFYYFFIEQSNSFSIVFKDLDGNEVNVKADSRKHADINQSYVSNPVNKEMMSFYNRKVDNWDFKLVDELPSTAQISLASFGGKGINSEEKAQEDFRKFMEKSLKKMERKEVNNLILELRGNRGGWDILGKELFTYLMKSEEPLPYYGGQYTITKDSEFLKYSDLDPAEFSKADTYLEPTDDGRFKLKESANPILRPAEPKPHRFKGNLYIIVDEQCVSTCAEFVAKVKSAGIAIIVGNETGGAYEGGNGGSFISFELPNSKIYSWSPLVKYEMAINEVSAKGLGTIPDHVKYNSLEDLLSGKSASKEYVYQLIKGRE